MYTIEMLKDEILQMQGSINMWQLNTYAGRLKTVLDKDEDDFFNAVDEVVVDDFTLCDKMLTFQVGRTLEDNDYDTRTAVPCLSIITRDLSSAIIDEDDFEADDEDNIHKFYEELTKYQPKLFRCNEEVTQVKEWTIARTKVQAYEFLKEFWDNGEIMDPMYSSLYLEENPDKTIEDFIEMFFIEEDNDKDFTHPYGGPEDEPVTKKVSEWIESVDEAPSYLCRSEIN